MGVLMKSPEVQLASMLINYSHAVGVSRVMEAVRAWTEDYTRLFKRDGWSKVEKEPKGVESVRIKTENGYDYWVQDKERARQLTHLEFKIQRKEKQSRPDSQKYHYPTCPECGSSTYIKQFCEDNEYKTKLGWTSYIACLKGLNMADEVGCNYYEFSKKSKGELMREATAKVEAETKAMAAARRKHG
jgi:hypothetical protein